MDPLGLLTGITDAENLPLWSEVPPSRCPSFSEERDSPFPVNKDINEKVCLW